jgi:dihydroorotase
VRHDDGPDPGGPAALVLAGRAWRGGRLEPVEIAVGEDGRIRSVGRVRDAGRRHDVGDRVILPAATDLHVHFRDPPGPTGVESIATGTVQAALGGVGLVGEMPNTSPEVSSVDALDAKEARVRGRAAVDVLLYASPGSPSALGALAARAGAFKLYLSPTTGIDRPVPPEELPGLLGRLAGLGLPVTVHAEDPSRFLDPRKAENPAAWNRARPPAAEEAAVERLLKAAPPALRVHVAHVTVPSLVTKLRSAGVSFEATPHHLLLEAKAKADARFKVNPPLRGPAERTGMWEAFRAGQIPCVASDHAPHALDRKQGPFDLAPSGVPGVETMLPLLLAEVRRGEVPLPVVLSSLCDRPARWLGQPMGRIAPGHRANLLVVDFRARSTVRADRLHAPAGWTPFEGREAIFPVEHWRDGERIVADGEFVGRPGGTVVRPDFAPQPP